MAEESLRKERFVTLEKREMRGVAISTIMMFAVPIFSIIVLAVQLTGRIDKGAEDLNNIEKKLDVINTKLETHSIKHSDCEKWRAVMEEKIKYLTK